ncbi:ABC transporter ATP-binding protein [Dehalococcoidia bacterium]|nr:ABC transporter ATP-binding protein [Dehalococcoidia bacterium]
MRLEIDGVQFRYGSVPVLEDVNLGIRDGEVLSLIGPNGSGKSTLLKCINRILKPKRGTILVKGRDVSRIGLKELARTLGYVPQSAPTSFPLTVFEAVLLGRKPHVDWRLSERDKTIAYGVIKRMELHEMALRMFNELSGGERQKVLMARALAQEPQVLLLDEPTSNLDLRHQLEVLELVVELVQEKGLSAVMAMHDLNLSSRFSNKIVMLKDGKIYAAGEPGDVLNVANIRTVYGVETAINGNSGRPHIIPLAPIRKTSKEG